MAQAAVISKPEKFSDLVKKCVKENDTDQLIKVLENHPTLHRSELKPLKSIISKSPKNHKVTEVLKLYCKKGIEPAKEFHRQPGQQNPILRIKKNAEVIPTNDDNDVVPQNIKITKSQVDIHFLQNAAEEGRQAIDNEYTPEEEQLLMNASTKDKEYDQETIYEEINVDDIKEQKEVENTMTKVESATKNIKKEVQEVTIAIDNKFSNLKVS